MKAKRALRAGEISQLRAMEPTSPHCTAAEPPATRPKPRIAPTIACVVETGQPKKEAA